MPTWIIQLSLGGTSTETALPAMAGACQAGFISRFIRPRRPCASCTVATPALASPWITLASARSMLRIAEFMFSPLTHRAKRP